MATNDTMEYKPFHPVHPFEILEDEIKARGISKKAFAESIGMKPSNFSRMLKMRGELTSEMSMKLESALGIPYIDWMRFQEEYMKDIMEMKEGVLSSENSAHAGSVNVEMLSFRLGGMLTPIKDQLESLNRILSCQKGEISEKQIEKIEKGFHKLGKELCALKLI